VNETWIGEAGVEYCPGVGNAVMLFITRISN
jgi:hypothetical protein